MTVEAVEDVTKPVAPRLAWSAVAVIFGFLAAHLSLGYFTGKVYDQDDIVFTVGTILVAFAFSVPGARIVTHQSRNAIGWLLIAIPLMFIFSLFVSDYAYEALVRRPGTLMGGRYAAWIDRWDIVPTLSMPILVFMLFPDGKVPSPRWKPALWLAIAAPTVAMIAFALTPGPMTGAFADLAHVKVVNPFGLYALKGFIVALTGIAGMTTGFTAFLAGASMFFRFRNRRGVERQQVKWLAFVGIAFLVELILLDPVSSLGDVAGNVMFTALFLTLILGVPVACAIAILKYRLYDIDRIINRALVYGALTATLALVYVGGVVGIGAIVRAVTRQEGNNLGVAASTLAVAGLFGPLRRGVQSFIDRRFYRHKYDARQTLVDFSASLRDQLDLDSLNAELVGVVTRTMQPSHVSLWLKPSVN